MTSGEDELLFKSEGEFVVKIATDHQHRDGERSISVRVQKWHKNEHPHVSRKHVISILRQLLLSLPAATKRM